MALLGLRGSGDAGPDVSRLAAVLRELYARPPDPWERWRHARPAVRLPDGREVQRDAAYRDDLLFTEAAAALLDSPEGDDAPLGAWLLGTARPGAGAGSVLVRALAHPDRRAAFEAARALAAVGNPAALPPLEDAARWKGAAEVRAAAAWAAEQVAERHGRPCPIADARPRTPEGFHRGVAWWRSEAGADAGAASFARLASLGVDRVSIHTWDPLQLAVDGPRLARPPRGLAFRGLPEIVRNAHAAGLKVMLKPHLEMSAHVEAGGGPWHNTIAMRTEADWREWFEGYGRYLLDYAGQARGAGADMLCVGRELDRTVALREADWRRLIARVRDVFPGPLVYSANFDSYRTVGFWDALDYVGVSAYFPLSASADPSLEDLATGWARALPGLEEVSRRFGRPVLLTEVGYPAARGAAGTPWAEGGPPADPWLQARCYEATLRAVAARPWIAGAYWWLWEGTTRPPFRDASYSIQGKPASFVLARWFRGW